MNASIELNVLIAEKIMGLFPCDEWRAVEWDGHVGVRCGNDDHYDFRKGIGVRDRCYATGIRESYESLEKSGEWKNIPILTEPNDFSYPETHQFFGPPSYSTYIADAWKVMDKMAADGWHVMVRYDQGRGYSGLWWTCAVGRREKSYRGDATTAPHAICLAALLTVGEEK